MIPKADQIKILMAQMAGGGHWDDPEHYLAGLPDRWLREDLDVCWPLPPVWMANLYPEYTTVEEVAHAFYMVATVERNVEVVPCINAAAEARGMSEEEFRAALTQAVDSKKPFCAHGLTFGLPKDSYIKTWRIARTEHSGGVIARMGGSIFQGPRGLNHNHPERTLLLNDKDMEQIYDRFDEQGGLGKPAGVRIFFQEGPDDCLSFGMIEWQMQKAAEQANAGLHEHYMLLRKIADEYVAEHFSEEEIKAAQEALVQLCVRRYRISPEKARAMCFGRTP